MMMKLKRWTRRMASLLVAAMLLSCLPLAAFAAESTSEAKAQLGTNATFSGDKVDLSKALYTFTGSNNVYTIKSTIANLYLNPGASARNPNQANSTPVTLSVVTKNDVTWFQLKGTKALYFYNNDTNKLYFDQTGGFVATGQSDFALFRQANKGESTVGDIPGYVRLSELNEVQGGGKYLIASLANETWYVLYPATGSNYAHVAKVVIETTTTEPDPVEPTDPPEQPTRPEGKPTIDANHDLYQVVVMCEEKDNKGDDADQHYWSYPKKNGWNTTTAQFTVGDVRENDLDNDTAEEYPYICPVTPAYTLDQCLTNINGESAGHRLVTTEATIPVAYYYWNATDGWQLLRDKQPDENVTFNPNGQWHEGTMTVYVTCAEAPVDPPVNPPVDPEPEAPTTKPVVAEGDLYQVEVVCREKGENPAHWWSSPNQVTWAWVDEFKVGEVEANTAYQPETYPWRCPVTPKETLETYLNRVNEKVGTTHTLVSTALPVAYYYYNAATGAWTFIKDTAANPNCTVSTDGKNTWFLSIAVTCNQGSGPVDPPVNPPVDPPVDPEGPGAPANQPTGDYTVPSDVLSGTGSREPMSDANVNSYFRIPALVTLPNGWLVAASDARWTNTTDSPNNLDTIVSVSKDGGETWDWEIVNYFADFAPLQGPTYYGNSTSGSAWASKTASASFIDPALTVDSSGKVWMLVDMLPSYGGNYTGNKTVAGTGFDDQSRLLLSHGTADGNASANAADYTYCVDLNAQPAKTAQKDGKSVGLYPICARDGGAGTGYYVDAFLDLWYDYEAGGVKPVLCPQKESSHYVQSNVFYMQSPWKVLCTFYIIARSAQVDEQSGRLVWSDPQLLNVKNAGERFTAVCPGRGTTVSLENGKERILFQVYDNATGDERASTVYSDDGGKTWQRGQRTDTNATAGKASESQVVHLPGGKLRMYSRNDKNVIRYADSDDNGVTWGAPQVDEALAYCGNDMVSFINVDGVLVSPDNKTYENVILASYAKENYRSSGVIRIGYVNDDAGQTVTWLNDDAIRFTGRYNYSCLTQLPDHEGFAVLYEQDDTSNPAKGVMAMRFATFTAADLLGEGWLLAAKKPAEAVTLTVDTSLIDLDFGGKRTVEIEYSPADAQVSWTSSDEAVVTAKDGVITAVASGRATVTVSVTKGAMTRSTTIPVMVQPESGALLLPEQYIDSVTTVVTPGVSSNVLVEKEALPDGTYLIYNGTTHVLHNSGSWNRCKATLNGKLLTEGVLHEEHKWTFTKVASGAYTIQASDGKYLTATGVGDSPVEFAVTYADGTYKIAKDGKIFVYNNAWQFAAADSTTIQLFAKTVTPDTTTYTVSAEGLTALIRAAELDAADYADAVALAGSYEDEEEAQAAQAAIAAAAQEVYALLRQGNLTRYLVTYTVQDELLAVQSYYPGEIIVPMTDPVRPGQIFTGWTGMPEGKVMPDHDLALVAAFRPVGTGSSSGGSSGGTSRPAPVDPGEDLKDPDVPLADKPAAFVDVAPGAWYAKAVAAVAAQGLIQGVGEDKYAPAASMTRASLAQVLYRLAKSEEKGAAAFADVAENAWYADAVAWAAKNGVVTGITGDRFAPDQTITRQELAVMLARYAKLAGLDTAADATALDQFADGAKTGAWAASSVAWCVEKGILEGKGGSALDPTAQVTRAEVAVMLDRFIPLIK